jgi:hypothetical protein
MKRLFASAISLLLVNCSVCFGACCQRCGCHATCDKVCRVVCETKEVKEPVYDCECEEFCLPGKSQRCVTYDECGCRQVVYTPTCGTVRTRNKLVKRTETKKVPSYRWVVEDLCERCATECTSHAAADNSGVAPADPFALEARRASLAPPLPPPPPGAR